MISTAPCVMFLMRADTLRGGVGWGLALEIESFVGPWKWHRSDIGECHLGPIKLEISSANPPATSPNNGPACLHQKTLRTGP
jgi:hypothetical protein